MFKRYVLPMIMIMIMVIVSGVMPATAAESCCKDGFYFKPYIGADYQYSKYGNESQDPAIFGPGVKTADLLDLGLHGGNVHVGARIHQNLGLELGYAQTQNGDKKNVIGSGLDTNGKVQAGTLDVLGYYPIADKLELIGTVGVSYAKGTFGGNAFTAKFDEEEVKPRIGAGAQYSLTDKFNLRSIVRYQGASFLDNVDNAVVATAGVNYQF